MECKVITVHTTRPISPEQSPGVEAHDDEVIIKYKVITLRSVKGGVIGMNSLINRISLNTCRGDVYAGR